MKKFSALTYVELAVAMMIIGVVITVGLQIMKPERNKGEAFFIATWNNLMNANEELIYLNEQDGGNGLPVDYCEQLADLLSLKGNHDCDNETIVLSSGVTLSDVSNDFSADSNITINAQVKVGRTEPNHDFTIYQSDGMLKPAGDDLTSTETFKFRVVSKETGQILADTRDGVSYSNAVCYMGVNAKYDIDDCNGIVHNTNFCPYSMSCKLEIVMPKLKSLI